MFNFGFEESILVLLSLTIASFLESFFWKLDQNTLTESCESLFVTGFQITISVISWINPVDTIEATIKFVSDTSADSSESLCLYSVCPDVPSHPHVLYNKPKCFKLFLYTLGLVDCICRVWMGNIDTRGGMRTKLTDSKFWANILYANVFFVFWFALPRRCSCGKDLHVGPPLFFLGRVNTVRGAPI